MSTKKPSSSAPSPALKSFADHLAELRTRLAWVALVFIVASALAYNVREHLVSIILSPIGHQKLVYLTPAGGFSFIFQISMYAGILATAPIAIYHIYRFVSPALPDHMRRWSLRIVFLSTLLMCMGVGFGYFVAIPAALQFLTNFGGDFVQANLTADSYLGFVMAYLLGLGVLFQLPLLLVFWNWIQPFKPGGLLSTQRYVIVGAFIAAAMITPTPDALNQCMIAVPIVGIYQLGVVAVFFMNKRKHQAPAKSRSFSTEQGAPGALKSSLEEAMTIVVPQATQEPAVATHTKSLQQTKRTVSSVASIDGFARVRTGSVGVPVRPRVVRAPNRATSFERNLRQQPVQRRQNSVDGFSFVS